MSSVLVVNPFASRVSERSLAAVARELGVDEVLRTEARGHATELARRAEAAGAGRLFVFSGDGGFNEVLNGVSGHVPLGFLPGGGTSVLPRALGLPREPLAAARALADGRERRISLGRANGRRFAFSAGIGIDAEAIRRMDARGRRPDGRRPGDLAFAWTLGRLVVGGDYAEPALEVDGRRVAFALVANLAPYTYVGRIGLRPHPGASAEGGLELVAPERFRLRSLPRYASYVMRGVGADTAGDIVYGHDLDRLVLRADRPLPLQVDGEDLGDATEVVLEAERDAVTVLS